MSEAIIIAQSGKALILQHTQPSLVERGGGHVSMLVVDRRDSIIEAKTPTAIIIERVTSLHGGGGGGGDGGHMIVDESGADMPSEGRLQFVGLAVTDDPTAGRTVVTNSPPPLVYIQTTDPAIIDPTIPDGVFWVNITGGVPPFPYYLRIGGDWVSLASAGSNTGGHIIESPTSVEAPAQPILRFVNLQVSDDPTNTRTNVELCVGSGFYWDADHCLQLTSLDPDLGFIITADGDHVVAGGDRLIA